MKTPRSHSAFEKRTARPKLSKILVGDKESANILLDALNKIVRQKPYSDTTLVWDMTAIHTCYLMIDPKSLPVSDFMDLFDGANLLFKIVLQHSVAMGFCYGQKGSILTSLYVSSVADALVGYFSRAAQKNPASAFQDFKKIVTRALKARKTIFQFVANNDGRNSVKQMRTLLRKLKPVHPRQDILFQTSLGNLMMAIHLHCGKKSSVQDRKDFKFLMQLLMKSTSMPEFLNTISLPLNLTKLPVHKHAA